MIISRTALMRAGSKNICSGTAEADAFCAELAGLRCITRSIAVGANVQGANRQPSP